MTKVTILGQPQGDEPKKKIEFKHGLSASEKTEVWADPTAYKNIVFLSENYCGEGFDLMYAYDEHINEGYLYLGHFNDGIV
jgi:hypothetical protein